MFKRKSQEKIYDHDLVGCFGKLPIHAEFIKYHAAASPEIIELDRWYQQAFHFMSRQNADEFKNVFQKMPLYHFIYLDSGKLPLLGTLISSCDKGGRVYPYVSFRILKHPLAQEFTSLIPWSYAEYLNKSKLLSNHSTLTELINDVNTLQKTAVHIGRRVLLERAVSALKKVSFANFTYSTELFTQLKTNILSLRNRQKSFIRLPILNEKLTEVSVIFWLQLLEFVLSDKYLQVFWTAGNNYHQPNILISLQALSPDNFQYLLEDDLAFEEPVNGIQISFDQVDPKMSLFEVLQKWSLRI